MELDGEMELDGAGDVPAREVAAGGVPVTGRSGKMDAEPLGRLAGVPPPGSGALETGLAGIGSGLRRLNKITPLRVRWWRIGCLIRTVLRLRKRNDQVSP